MNDPALTLKNLIEKEWDLSNPVKADVYFRIGEPCNLKDRFAVKHYSIEVTKSSAPIIHQTGARSIFNERIVINVWAHVTPETEETKEKVFEIRQTIVEKIKDIIFLNRKSVEGVRFTYLGGDRVFDTLPYLRTLVEVRCTYSHP